MDKNLEKSLKRFLKRTVKITMGLVVSFLITGTVSFAEEIKGADKKTETKKISAEEYIINEEILKNILSRISVGNIDIIGKNETVGEQEINGGLGINNGTLTGDRWGECAQDINGGLGINNGTISNGEDYGQGIENGLGINNGIISNGDYGGQYIDGGMGINNGIISNGGNAGQQTFTGGLAINNGIISNGGDYGQDINGGLGINNGIIINKKAYDGTFYKNGISLKRDNNKLVLNNDNGYNDNIYTLGNDKLTAGNKLSEVITNNKIEQKNVGQEIINGQAQDVKGYNLFINNLGNETNGNDTDNQLVIDTNLSENFANTHITTAVTNGSFDNANGAVIKISKNPDENKFSMDKSTIVGYFEQDGTLVNMNGAMDITLNDSIISVFAGSDKTGFTGNIPTDVNAIKFAEGSEVTLNNSTVNGKMDFSAGGNNILNLNGKYNGTNHDTYKDGTQYGTYVSDVEFGTGNDKIEIKFTETKDGNEVTDYNSSYDKKGLINLGKVNFGDGDDTLSFSFDEMKKGNFVLAGDIDFGAGNDTVALKSKIDMNDQNSRETLIVLNNLLFNKIAKNPDGTSNLENLQLADGGNTFYFKKDSESLDFNGKVIGGNGDDKFIVSADELQNISVDGGAEIGGDTLELTTAVTGNEDFSKITNIENLQLAENSSNIIDLNNLSFKNITGGKGDDIFKISALGLPNISVNGGAEIGGDTLELTSAVTGNVDFSKITNVENLQLNNEENILTLDNASGFKNITGGKGDDTFKISALGLPNISINGGVDSTKETKGDTLEFTSKVDNTEKTGNKDLFNGVSNIENLQLAENSSNIIDLDNLTFKNITAKNGNDTFIISAENLGKIDILNGGENSADGKDILKLAEGKEFNNTTQTQNIFDKVSGIERLELNNSQNTVDVGNLNNKFSEIAGGTGNDTFIIKNQADYSKVFGGDGEDKIKFTGNFDNTQDDIVSSIFSPEKGFESIDFSGDKNDININDKFTDKTFYFNGQTNNINIKNEISAENLVFENGTNNVVLEESGNLLGEVNFTNGSKDTLTVNKNSGEFDLNVNGAEKIVLGGASGEWKFTNGSLITGNTNLDLQNKTLNLLDNEKNISASDTIINSGNIHLQNGNLVLGDLSFIGEKSNVTVSNGTIKIGFAESVKFAEGVNTEFTLSLGERLSLGENVNFETYSFINEIGKDLKVTVKKWEDYDEVKNNKDYLIYGKRYDESLKKYNTAGNEALTNAFNIFGSDTVVDYIVNGTNPKLLYESDNGGKYEVLIAESGEDIIIKTSETETVKDTALTFNNISSTGKITVAVTEGTNEITFGDKTNSQSSVSINGENGIDFSTSTTAVTINIAGEKINDITKIIANNSDNTINLSGKNISVNEISLGTGDNTISISDISNVTLGIVTGKGNNTIDIENKITDVSSSKFMDLLKNENLTGISQINLGEDNEITIDNDYSFDKDINLSSNNNITVTNGTLKADKLEFTGNNNQVILNGGNMTGTLSFAEGQKENVFEVNKTEGIFNYGIKNADEIKLSGADEWKFENGAKISGNNVAVNVENGTIVFTGGIKNNSLALGKDGVNPFDQTGNYIVNGNIKLTFDDTLKFNSASDLENIFTVNKSNISLGQGYKVSVPEFLNYENGKISVKSADDLGIDKIAHGNYEYLLTKYYNKENDTVTEMFNTNSAEDIKNKVENSIFDELHLYSFNGTKDNLLTLNKVYIETNEKGEKTNVIFNNISAADEFLINVSGAENNISLLGNVSFEKGINGSNSEGIINLSLGGGTINLNDNAVVLGKNDDSLNLLSSINGTLDGFEGDNILNIGENKPNEKVSDKNSQKEIVLDGEIKNFGEINLNQDTKLNSDLKFADKNESEKVFSETEKINLNGNNLILGVDETKVSGEKDNKPIITGHAFYDKGIEVNNQNGQIVIDVNGKTFNSFISMGEENKTTFTDENNFTTNSVNFEVEYDKDNGLVNLHTKEHFLGKDEIMKYAHLDKIYQSIVSAGDKILLMNPSASTENKSKEEAVKAQLEFYGKIYHSTPYAYSNDVSKKSADLITESIMNLDIMPKHKEWIFGGSIAGQESGSDSNFYGSNYYTGIDIGKNEVSADTNIYGAYAFGKYGISENQSVGFAIAGTRSDTDISGNSKLEGDAVYVSAFAEQEKNNLKLLAGISYQHSFYDSTRNVSNDYQSMSVDKKYEDDLISIFAGGKYSYHLGNNFFAEPNVKLSVTHVMQDSIDEGNNGKELTIETDKKDFTFVEGEIGLDLVKKINLSKGILNIKAGTSLVYSLDGYQEEYLTGRITGAEKDFEMISPEDDRSKIKFTVGTEYEMINGMFMNLHGNYTTSSHTEDYAVSFGAGYKF